MSRTVKWAIGVGVVLVLVLVVVASVRAREKNVEKVTTAKAAKEELVSTVSCNGRIRARVKVDISSQVMGQIVTLAVREGDEVKKGDLLLQIDKVQYDANAQAQQAALDALFAQREADRFNREQAERDFERVKKNFEAKIDSEQNLQKARLALDSAIASEKADERRIEQARQTLLANRDSLRKTTLVSPIDGIVTARPVEQGENAIIGTMNNPGTVLLTVSDMSIVEAEMEVDETDIPHVKLGQKAKLSFDAYPEKKYDGTVTEIGGSPITKSALGTDSSAVNFKVKIHVLEPPKNIRPGFSVSGLIETDRRPDVLAIPIPALVLADETTLVRAGKGKKPEPTPTAVPAKDEKKDPLAGPKKKEVEGVFVVKKDGTVEFRKIKTGLTAELKVEVTEGLAEGEEIVTGPFKALRTLKIGDRIKVDNAAAPGAGKTS
ncbi:MAG TPA: efflux RND transporter periplasmic adaptor subunit [Thermoanaerobaculia bacterium]|nr:efflux RND transporter periplasmic adaptor subunit [Thermoanaerobaculia bacterium]HQR66573.1 efflux RND transporter periplasmic adaptor subunit [Thermoanaerobaculia bacterium]